jgi:tRNA-specific 2-thiouridylase
MTGGSGKKVVVAMSGGVDSSVAAALLQEQGYDVVGCFMRLGSMDEDDISAAGAGPAAAEPTPHHQGCCSLNDACDARMVAGLLGVAFYVLNFRRDFDQVIDHFVAEYNAGRTPNPCVRCNDWLKFGKLMTYARSLGAQLVATGHYARVEAAAGETQLLRGVDHDKDQSYVLFGSSRADLARMLLPVGGLHKVEVRAIAQRRGLPVFDKPDSQEICFVPDNDYAGLIRRRTPGALVPGDIIDPAGHVLGRHAGHQNFTIGQRRGVGVAQGHPLYVIAKDAKANTVTIDGPERLLSSGLTAADTNWLIPPPTDSPRRCTVKVRYRGSMIPATVVATSADGLEVAFDQPQSAVAPGQAVVCYEGERVLGGGWIVSAFPLPVGEG